MNNSKLDTTTFAQNQFSAQIDSSRRELKMCTYKKRAVWAWVFFAKITIIVSGIALSTGLDVNTAKELGIAIAIITAIEAALRNHARLILLEDQHIAISGLLKDIENKHTEKMPSILAERDENPVKSMNMLNDLNNTLRQELFSEQKKICDAYKQRNKTLLKSLAVSKSGG